MALLQLADIYAVLHKVGKQIYLNTHLKFPNQSIRRSLQRCDTLFMRSRGNAILVSTIAKYTRQRTNYPLRYEYLIEMHRVANNALVLMRKMIAVIEEISNASTDEAMKTVTRRPREMKVSSRSVTEGSTKVRVNTNGSTAVTREVKNVPTPALSVTSVVTHPAANGGKNQTVPRNNRIIRQVLQHHPSSTPSPPSSPSSLSPSSSIRLSSRPTVVAAAKAAVTSTPATAQRRFQELMMKAAKSGEIYSKPLPVLRKRTERSDGGTTTDGSASRERVTRERVTGVRMTGERMNREKVTQEKVTQERAPRSLPQTSTDQSNRLSLPASHAATRTRSGSSSSNFSSSSRASRSSSASTLSVGNLVVYHSDEKEYDAGGEIVRRVRFKDVPEYSEEEDAPTGLQIQKQLRQKMSSFRPQFRSRSRLLNSQEGMAFRQFRRTYE
ncbi:DEKNAAC104146 [Brettanomyces naardenensis]|uniref:DEKNAAC104146 n=1 Tax=Brettanomyces naardenensis TaxID=13370 RepID=A0A448YQF0_BRENA|nr:DEKNAAC104146 [Brettanomyces naardenensis]